MPSTAHCSFSTYKRGTCLLKLYTENLTPCNHRTTTLKGKPGKNEPPLKGLIYHLKAAPSPTHCPKKKKLKLLNPKSNHLFWFYSQEQEGEIKISMKAKVLETGKGKERNPPSPPVSVNSFPSGPLDPGQG